jgi:hypothetical protein
MIKDVHINNPKRSLLREVEFRYRLGSFTQSSEITGCFAGGRGWKSSGDCVLAEVGDSVLYHSLAEFPPPTAFFLAVNCLRCRQAVNMDLSDTTSWFATPAMRLYRL